MSKISAWTRQWAQSSGHTLWYEPRTTSTNDIAKENEDFKIFITNHQTAGRGRSSNTWTDEGEGGNLIASWKLKLNHPPQAISGPVFGLALYRAAQKTWPAYEFSLKAPNDLYLDGLKVAGVLIESTSQASDHQLVFGIGLNVTSHPEGIESTHLESKGEVSEDQWSDFLENLQLQLDWAAIACQESELSTTSCAELLEALNKNPHLIEKCTQITAQGDLKTSEKTVPWTSL